MTKDEVVERLCELASRVGSEVFQDQSAHNCFCGENDLSERFGFRFDEEVLLWIESAVKERMAKYADEPRAVQPTGGGDAG